jgi:hypothetical protein
MSSDDLRPSRREQCAAVKADGERCRGTVIEGSRFCFSHDPQLKQRRIEGNVKGGRNRSSLVRMQALVPPRLMTVYETLEDALADVRKGKLDPRVAHAMAALARAMVSVLQVGEMEMRLRDLEEKAQYQAPPSRWKP